MEKQLIYEKMAKIMQGITALPMKSKNTHFNYNFRGVYDTYNHLHSILSSNEVFQTCTVIKTERYKEKCRTGEKTIVSNTYRFRFYTTDGSYIETEAIGEAEDCQDKASSKSMSIAHKYALIQCFCIPTKDIEDPDYNTNESPSAYPAKKSQQSPKAWLNDYIKSYFPEISREKLGFIGKKIMESVPDKSGLAKWIKEKTYDGRTMQGLDEYIITYSDEYEASKAAPKDSTQEIKSWLEKYLKTNLENELIKDAVYFALCNQHKNAAGLYDHLDRLQVLTSEEGRKTFDLEVKQTEKSINEMPKGGKSENN